MLSNTLSNLKQEQMTLLDQLCQNEYFLCLLDFCEKNVDNNHYAIVLDLKAEGNDNPYELHDISWIKLENSMNVNALDIYSALGTLPPQPPIDYNQPNAVEAIISQLQSPSWDKLKIDFLDLLNPHIKKTRSFGYLLLMGEEATPENLSRLCYSNFEDFYKTIDYIFEYNGLEYIKIIREKLALKSITTSDNIDMEPSGVKTKYKI